MIKAVDIVNTQRTAFTNLLCHDTINSAEEVLQTVTQDGFEEASEFGEPRGSRPSFESRLVGANFRDFDLATRWTWRALRDMSQAQIEQSHQAALAADNRLVTETILKRLLDPTIEINREGRNCYGLYNGDAMLPERYAFNTFSEPHNHYLTSGSDEPDGADIDDLARTITEHGYGSVPGARLVLFAHPDDLGPLALARAGDLAGAKFDFIPSAAAPPYLTSETVVGEKAPADWNGMEVAGSYGRVLIASHPFMPPNYLLMVASGGPKSNLNPVQLRQHPTPEWQGLRLLPGPAQRYPLVDSTYTRAMGVGVRHRGAAAVMQITTDSDYAPPSVFAG